MEKSWPFLFAKSVGSLYLDRPGLRSQLTGCPVRPDLYLLPVAGSPGLSRQIGKRTEGTHNNEN